MIALLTFGPRVAYSAAFTLFESTHFIASINIILLFMLI